MTLHMTLIFITNESMENRYTFNLTFWCYIDKTTIGYHSFLLGNPQLFYY